MGHEQFVPTKRVTVHIWTHGVPGRVESVSIHVWWAPMKLGLTGRYQNKGKINERKKKKHFVSTPSPPPPEPSPVWSSVGGDGECGAKQRGGESWTSG